MTKAIIFLLICISLNGCFTHNEANRVYKPIPVKDTINNYHISYFDFNYLFSSTINSKNYAVSLNVDSSLFIFKSVEVVADSFSLKIINPEKIISYKNLLCRIQDNYIYIYCIDVSILYRLERKDYLVEVKNQYDISYLLVQNKFFVKTQNESFEVFWPKIFLPIGINSDKYNFLDKNSHLELQIDSNSNQITYKKAFHFLPKFLYKFERNSNTFLKALNDSIAFFGYRTHDSIYLYNINKDVYVERKLLTNFSQYKFFDKSKSKDIYYIRLHETTNENNRNVIVIKNKILIVKHLGKREIVDSDIFEYYLLDKNINVINNGLLPSDANPSKILPFKNGFIVQKKESKKFYYYEVE